MQNAYVNCPNCGTPIPTAPGMFSAKCPNCQTQFAIAQQPGTPYQPATPPSPNTSNSNTLIIVCGIVAIALIFAVATYFILRSNDEPTVQAAAPVVVHDTVVQEKTTVVSKPVQTVTAPATPARTVTSSSGGGQWPYTSQRYLSEDELWGYSKATLRVMRNEIYARHGYIFDSADLRAHFSGYSWYVPRTKNPTLSRVESANVNTIKRVENLK